MASHRVAPPDGPMHRKSFTGCWTCRARKVKCDELRPVCQQCFQKNLNCEGYDIRLQWMPPETGNGSSSDVVLSQVPPPKTYRSKVLQGTALPVCPFYEIDDIMYTIDSFRPETLATKSQHSQPATRMFKCFGIFDSQVYSSQRSAKCGESALASPTSTTCSPPQQDSTGIDVPAGSKSPVITEANAVQNPDASHSYRTDSRPNNLPLEPLPDFLLDPLSSDFGSDSGGGVFGNIPLQELPLDFGLYSALPLLRDSSQQEDSVIETEGNKDLSPASTTTSQRSRNVSIEDTPIVLYTECDQLRDQERFLLNYYASNVVHLFCALDNPKSPWKTIHLPRALQSAGELVVSGSTSQIRHALRNALLSISALHLSNTYRIQSRELESIKWNRAGVCYRGIALKHLKEAVESGLTNESRPKYKECLATILSMISINVWSGDTETCGVHLDGALRLINQARSWKSRYSSKAKALHRIYFYLRTIFQSTITAPKAPGSEIAWMPKSIPPSGSRNATSEILESIRLDDTPLTLTKAGAESQNHMCTYAHIYGIPHDLVVLLNRTVEVVACVIEERERTKSRDLPADLASQCSEMEGDIMGWLTNPTTDDVSNSTSSKRAINSGIVNHMTQAFYNAIIIYFAQHIHLLSHYYLQTYVARVIDSIEAIEKMKTETKITAAPLYWPAFIAASEAFEPAIQNRFRRWYEQVEVYGIESVRTGLNVLHDVWKQGPSQDTKVTSVWRTVAQRTGATLILS